MNIISPTIGINNINGLCDNGFWRNNTLGRAYEHTAFTNIEKLDEVVKQKKYRTETAQELLLEYTYEAKPTDLSGKEGAVTANNIEIVYSSYHTTSYNYDTTNKVYKRFMSNEPHVDLATKEQYTAKNIIIEIVENTSIDSYGRQDLKNIGTHNGYYITNGYAIPIKCVKPNRSEQTTYQYMDGTEIVVNDGNTYIQIQPKGQKLTIE